MFDAIHDFKIHQMRLGLKVFNSFLATIDFVVRSLKTFATSLDLDQVRQNAGPDLDTNHNHLTVNLAIVRKFLVPKERSSSKRKIFL